MGFARRAPQRRPGAKRFFAGAGINGHGRATFEGVRRALTRPEISHAHASPVHSSPRCSRSPRPRSRPSPGAQGLTIVNAPARRFEPLRALPRGRRQTARQTVAQRRRTSRTSSPPLGLTPAYVNTDINGDAGRARRPRISASARCGPTTTASRRSRRSRPARTPSRSIAGSKQVSASTSARHSRSPTRSIRGTTCTCTSTRR